MLFIIGPTYVAIDIAVVDDNDVVKAVSVVSVLLLILLLLCSLNKIYFEF